MCPFVSFATSWQPFSSSGPGQPVLLSHGRIDALGFGEEFHQLHSLEQVAARADAPGEERLLRALHAQPHGVQQVSLQTDFQVGAAGPFAKKDL